MKELSETFHGSTQVLAVGEQFKVALSANPTAGYTWEINRQDAQYLHLVSEDQVPYTSEKIGLGTLVTFEFEAIRAGSTELELIYRRSWDPNSGMNRFFIKVEIG